MTIITSIQPRPTRSTEAITITSPRLRSEFQERQTWRVLVPVDPGMPRSW